MVKRQEKCLEMPGMTEDKEDQAPTSMHDLTRYLDKVDQEPPQSHPQPIARVLSDIAKWIFKSLDSESG